MAMTHTSATNGEMSSRERSDLVKLIRQRERVAKTETKKRSARLKADAEMEMNTIFNTEDGLWNDLVEVARDGMNKINKELEARARQVGLPKAMGYPRLQMSWTRYDSHYGDRGRRAEIRQMIDSRLADQEASARAEIEQQSLAAQTEILAGGLTSDAARAVLASLPTVEALMPPLDLAALELVMPGLGDGWIATTIAAIQAGDVAVLKGADPAAALLDGDGDDEEDD
jgi:hypothetical protein